LFADEPTGNLDQATGLTISDLLFELNQQSDTTLVLVTHEQRLAERCDDIVIINDGLISTHGGIEIGDEYRLKAQELGLELANVAEFRSMVFAGDSNHLASVKAVEDSYPLRGVVELADSLSAKSVIKVSNGPDKGEAWVEARLLNLLDTKLGAELEVEAS